MNISLIRDFTSRDENDIGFGDGDDDDVEPRTEEEEDAESSDLVRILLKHFINAINFPHIVIVFEWF